MFIPVTSSVFSSFPREIKRQESICEEVCYICSTPLPRQDMGEKKIMWSTRNNAQLKRQAEEKGSPGTNPQPGLLHHALTSWANLGVTARDLF